MTKVMSKRADKNGRGGIGRILRRLVLGVFGLIVLLVVFIAASIAIDGWIGRSATDFTNVTFTSADGTELHGYLAQPSNRTGDSPAIIMFHEWWGLNDDITRLADALAQQGYVVLAPDAYRGKTTRWIPRAVWLVSTTDENAIAADMDAAFNYLAGLENVNAKRMGTVGFCFGGRQSLNLAMRRGEGLAAVVSLYGTAYTEKAPLEALPSNVPILGIYGEEDASISAEDVRTMDGLMDEVGLNHEITIYPDVGHAFVTDENYDQAGAGGEAWAQLSAFFATQLGDDGGEIRPNFHATQPFEPTAPIANLSQLLCLVSH